MASSSLIFFAASEKMVIDVMSELRPPRLIHWEATSAIAFQVMPCHRTARLAKFESVVVERKKKSFPTGEIGLRCKVPFHEQFSPLAEVVP